MFFIYKALSILLFHHCTCITCNDLFKIANNHFCGAIWRMTVQGSWKDPATGLLTKQPNRSLHSLIQFFLSLSRATNWWDSAGLQLSNHRISKTVADLAIEFVQAFQHKVYKQTWKNTKHLKAYLPGLFASGKPIQKLKDCTERRQQWRNSPHLSHLNLSFIHWAWNSQIWTP